MVSVGSTYNLTVYVYIIRLHIPVHYVTVYMIWLHELICVLTTCCSRSDDEDDPTGDNVRSNDDDWASITLTQY